MNQPHLINPQCKVEQLGSTLYQVKDFFTDLGLTWILQHYGPGYNWQFEGHTPNRLSHRLEITDTTNQLAGEVQNFLSAHFHSEYGTLTQKLFFDTRGYTTGHHWDDEQIAAIVQIYLKTNYIGAPGTIFYVEQTVQTEFVPNTGYINLNHDKKIHFSSPVTAGHRQSYLGSFYSASQER